MVSVMWSFFISSSVQIIPSAWSLGFIPYSRLSSHSWLPPATYKMLLPTHSLGLNQPFI